LISKESLRLSVAGGDQMKTEPYGKGPRVFKEPTHHFCAPFRVGIDDNTAGDFLLHTEEVVGSPYSAYRQTHCFRYFLSVYTRHLTFRILYYVLTLPRVAPQ
jgi:hypothetical protein